MILNGPGYVGAAGAESAIATAGAESAIKPKDAGRQRMSCLQTHNIISGFPRIHVALFTNPTKPYGPYIYLTNT